MNLSVTLPSVKQALHAVARAVACCVLALQPSCGIPHLRLAAPAPGLPPTFNGAASPDSSAQLTFDEFYCDPLLTNLLHQAVANNRELKVLEEEVVIAQNEARARSGAYLPFATFATRASIEKHSRYTLEGAVEDQLEYAPGKRFPSPLPDYRFGFRFLWQIDLWRELRNARDAAQQRALAAVERRNDFVTRLVADVADNYYGLMALDKRLETLDRTIELQAQSQKFAEARKREARGTELAVQRFQAEVRRNQSEKLIVRQEIVEAENRINVLVNRYPQPVERSSTGFYDLTINALKSGLPAQLLHNRPDIRQAERELAAAGLDVLVARAHFFPRLDISGGVGYRSFNAKYLLNTPEALVYDAAGDLVAPLLNRRAVQAEYSSANARQLEAVYNYQRVILNAFTEVINRLAMVENYSKSLDVKKQQLESLEASVDSATKLFQNARAEYVEVLLAQRDLLEARTVVIDTKRRQLSAVVNAYQALGGGGQTPKAHPLPPAGPTVEVIKPPVVERKEPAAKADRPAR